MPPATLAQVDDARGRFREIFCAVLEARGETLPDFRPCEEALTRVGIEPPGSGRPVDLGPSRRRLVAALVPGIGWSCFEDWLHAKETAVAHVRWLGYDLVGIDVAALSSSTANARLIRDAILAMGPIDEPDLVLIGYSKGAPDILEAVAAYPEIRNRIAAVVSSAGAVGGSPLADDVSQSQVELLRHWPEARCTPGDGGAMESLRLEVRRPWLEQHDLPGQFPYYSLVTYPEPRRVSTILKPCFRTLAHIDARNDGMLLIDDQVIPGSTLLGFVNADHWALTVPIARTHPVLGSTLVEENDFPREALLEAVLRFIEEDLETASIQD